MLYTFCIVLILIASVLIILAVLVQSPKSGMAANFGASNQVMGVRQTADFLEKFTWTMAVAILVLSLVATLAMDRDKLAQSTSSLSKDAQTLIEKTTTDETSMPQMELPATDEAAAEEPAAAETAEPAATAEQPAAETK